MCSSTCLERHVEVVWTIDLKLPAVRRQRKIYSEPITKKRTRSCRSPFPTSLLNIKRLSDEQSLASSLAPDDDLQMQTQDIASTELPCPALQPLYRVKKAPKSCECGVIFPAWVSGTLHDERSRERKLAIQYARVTTTPNALRLPLCPNDYTNELAPLHSNLQVLLLLEKDFVWVGGDDDAKRLWWLEDKSRTRLR